MMPWLNPHEYVISASEVLRAAKQVHPSVYVFDARRPSLCQDLLELSAKVEKAAPNSMNHYGTVLHDPGARPKTKRGEPQSTLTWWLRKMVRVFVQPIATAHYKDFKALQTPYAFTVEYSSKQRALAPHIDAPSAVTLNVCLGGDFDGGALVFSGRRCKRHELDPVRDEEIYEVPQKIGQAIVHLGHHQHRARQITRGTRTNLILWCSAKRRSRKHPSWCDARVTP